MFDSLIAITVAEWFPPDGPTVNPWPFPSCPPTPWTPKQEQAYQQAQRAQLPESPM